VIESSRFVDFRPVFQARDLCRSRSSHLRALVMGFEAEKLARRYQPGAQGIRSVCSPTGITPRMWRKPFNSEPAVWRKLKVHVKSGDNASSPYIPHVVGRMLGQFPGQFGAFLGTLGNQELRTPSMSAKPQLLEALFRVNHPLPVRATSVAMRRLGFSRGSSESGNKIDIIYNNCQLIRPARGGASAVTVIMHLRAKWPSVGLAVDDRGPWPVC
jgi:hypothetical protein